MNTGRKLKEDSCPKVIVWQNLLSAAFTLNCRNSARNTNEVTFLYNFVCKSISFMPYYSSQCCRNSLTLSTCRFFAKVSFPTVPSSCAWTSWVDPISWTNQKIPFQGPTHKHPIVKSALWHVTIVFLSLADSVMSFCGDTVDVCVLNFNRPETRR